jgi:hypothetical protein
MLSVKLSYFFLSIFPLFPVPKKDNVLSTIKPKITFAIQILIIQFKKGSGWIEIST